MLVTFFREDNGVLIRGAVTTVIVGLIILASILVKRCSCKKPTRKYVLDFTSFYLNNI